MKRRVVVTGIGMISPLGKNTQQSWESLLSGKSAVTVVEGDEYIQIPCKVAAAVSDDVLNKEFNHYFTMRDFRSMSRATIMGIIAAEEALADSQWKPTTKKGLESTGVCVGMGMSDIAHISEMSNALKLGYNSVTPFFVPRILTNMTAGQISIKYGFQGPNHSVSTACATGAHSIGDAFRLIQNEYADVMVCGGAEASINPLSIAGFSRMRALSTDYKHKPLESSRPFDVGRDGFVMGEGASIMILEELNHALSRNVKIYAEVIGYGMSGDASHLTAPHEDGRGAILAMERAIKDSNLSLKDISYINAHATSTVLGDAIELKAIRTLFKDHCKNIAISSTKGATGHLLGAAGNLEACFTALACFSREIPPTINLQSVCEEGKGLNIVANHKQVWGKAKRIALKNSFGFGGTNACLCLSSF
ncbi:3-oxoacyl-[acyl-carrier-protein] synthase, mitochondrial-like [Macrosteles quadrilineatus]|uniref:3-oxoacyl-[acyl-carrier-protein] synthase, mitochondrial-like n=1 Tax=Macrosteles quadrilineatus TaxID=74068 RepID=UPI0023E13D82|nr:3-oxoacyl-[acyl-carrier-protein] synthase, mitochondrial-like [Macrosteles quadrilineatus]